MSSHRTILSSGRPPRKDSLVNKPTILTRRPSNSSGSSANTASTARSPERSSHPQYNVTNNSEASASSTNLSNAAPNMRAARKVSYDLPFRQPTPPPPQHTPSETHRHRRQHSQGFFEPSLASASHSNSSNMSHLTASQIAAQAAMQVQSNTHNRKRSETVPAPARGPHPPVPRRPSGQLAVQTSDNSSTSSRGNSQTRPTLQVAGQFSSSTATTAANAAFPKSPIPSPILQQGEYVSSPTFVDRDQKPNKEKSRMKIFSKPKSINISGYKDAEKKNTATPSPRKGGVYGSSTMPRMANSSMVSLPESTMSGASSIYSLANASTSTLVPGDRSIAPEKEKTRHHFLHRQKNKLKDGSEHYSSASSNSRPIDPNAPQPLYSFAPSSPGPSSTVTKSKTGLDLRHGGRALREKKREEKAAAGTFVPPLAKVASASDAHTREHQPSGSDWGPSTNASAASVFGPGSASSTHQAELVQGLGGFGLAGMTLDDAWPLLKARLLNIFEGEDIRTPIEDFNKLVLAHLQRCVQQKTPAVILDDLRELLDTGFFSIDQILRRVTDDRLVPHLVETWSFVFGTVLPFMQAVFHPLDLEIRGRGQILSPKEARDFWGALPVTSKSNPLATPHRAFGHVTPTSAPSITHPHRPTVRLAFMASVLDVRTLVLLSFRDAIIAPRYDTLLNIFSRLSLENMGNAALPPAPQSPFPRPDTSTSSSSAANDPVAASFNSQASTLLDSSTAGSLGARSRATSNTSAMSTGSFTSMASQRPHASSHGSSRDGTMPLASNLNARPLPPSSAHMPMPVIAGLGNAPDSAQITQTAARMLQCVSVLAALQTPYVQATNGVDSNARAAAVDGNPKPTDEGDAEDATRRKMENLGKELKLNWLGRSRTGRNRRGLVGTRQMASVTTAA